MKLKTIERVFIVLAAASLIFCAGFFTGLRQRRDVRVKIERAPLEELSPESPDAVRIDINTASAEELKLLPGIGDVLAERIIAYRDEHSGFETVEDLMKVEGIGQGIFASLRELIKV